MNTTSYFDSENTRRRSSSRAIKRPKFDDELVESSLGSQNTTPISKLRTRNPSLSTASECSISLPTTPTVTIEPRKRLPPRSTTKKNRKTRRSQSVIKNLGRWKPTDDLSLILGVQQTCDLPTVHRGIKFSCKFTYNELQERWYALLYDPTISRVAQLAMKNLLPDQIQAVQAGTLYSKAEEELLGTIKNDSGPTLETFETILRDNPAIFYPGRTSKALFYHWQSLKQYCLLQDQSPVPIIKAALPEDFSSAEKSIHDNELLYDVNDDAIEHEMSLCDRGLKKELMRAEDQVSSWEVVVESVRGIAPQNFDNKTLAVLKGRLVRYLMCSREITIGRKAAGNDVLVDLSLEGPAWKVSRKQGIIQLRDTGEFFIANEGRRAIFVDGKSIMTRDATKLYNNSVIEISCLRFTFLINQDLVHNTIIQHKIGSIKTEPEEIIKTEYFQ